MELVREFIVSGGLNLDDSFESIPNGDYYNAWNLVKRNIGGNTDALEVIVGNVQTNSSSFGDSAGKFTTTDSVYLGKIDAPKDDVSYLFFYGITRPHCIIKLNTASATVTLVLAWTGLNFINNTDVISDATNKEKRISGFVIAGPTGDLLYFTDNNNEPRCVHTTRYSGGSIPDSEEEIAMLKRGPYYAPVSYTSNTGSTNSIIYQDWIFSIQYVYFDNQVSVLSPYSQPVKRQGATDIYDTINVTFDPFYTLYPASIPKLVKEIRLYAKQGNSGVFALAGSNLITNIGDSFYAFFAFKGITGAILEDHYTQQFELFPYQIADMAFSSNRTWIANYVEGRDKYLVSNITGFSPTVNTTYIGTTPTTTNPTFSPLSSYKVGFVLRDSSGRAAGVVTDPSFVVRIGDDVLDSFYGNIANQYAPYQSLTLAATLSNLPSWVKDVGIVITKDLNKAYFKRFQVNTGLTTIPGTGVPHSTPSSYYVSLDQDNKEIGASPTFSNQKYIAFTANSISDYVFVSGDRIAYKKIGGSSFDLPIVKFINGVFYCDSVSGANAPGSILSQAVLAIVYRPVSEDISNIFYEVGSQRVSGTTYKTYLIPSSGVVVFNTTIFGDTLLIGSEANPSFSWSFCENVPYMKERKVWDTFHGRPFVESRIDKVIKSTWFRFGAAFTSSVAVNQIAEFTTLSERNVSPNSGRIQKLVPTVRDSTQSAAILVICDTDTYTIYINEYGVSQGDSYQLVSTSAVIGDLRLQQSGFGTIHPESIVSDTNGHVYWYDNLGGVFVRYANNGIFPISNYKVSSHFQTISFSTSSKEFVISGYDPYNKMIIVLFYNYSDPVRRCIGYHIPSERWTSFYAISTGGFYSGAKNLYSISGGRIYIHSDQVPATTFGVPNFGNLYGVQNVAYVNVSFNDDPATNKEWKVFESQMSPNMTSYSGGLQFVNDVNYLVTATNRKGQSTTLKYRASGEPEFSVDDDIIYGAFKRDESTYGVWVPSDRRLLNGDPMYSTSLQVQVQFSGGTTPRWIRYIKVGDQITRGHNL